MAEKQIGKVSKNDIVKAVADHMMLLFRKEETRMKAQREKLDKDPELMSKLLEIIATKGALSSSISDCADPWNNTAGGNVRLSVVVSRSAIPQEIIDRANEARNLNNKISELSRRIYDFRNDGRGNSLKQIIEANPQAATAIEMIAKMTLEFVLNSKSINDATTQEEV